MTTYTVLAPAGKGKLIAADKPLGRGGEGSVYSVESHDLSFLPPASELVVKIYAKPAAGNRRAKVITMVNAQPKSDSLAWPLAIVSEGAIFKGYIMRKLDAAHLRPWADMAHIGTRRDSAPDFGVNYALAACVNLARAIGSVHVAGHALGDINESNAFVGSNASVTIVDTDSAQIKSPSGEIYRCEVGKPEFTAPELTDKPFRESTRTVQTDMFAFGVMAFQMITGGAHPTAGRHIGEGDPQRTGGRIAKGIYPALRNETSKGYSTPPHVPLSALPSRFAALMRSIFLVEPALRPSFDRVEDELRDIQSNLAQCSRVSTHWFDARDGSDCGWCVSAAANGSDPWGEKVAQQKPEVKLPPISFNAQQTAPTVARRSPPRIAGSGAPATPRPTQQSTQSIVPIVPISGPSPVIPAGPLPGARSSGGGGSYNPGLPAPSYQPTVHVPPAPAPTPPQPKVPTKIKGKMVVRYPDGTYGQRPSMKSLMDHNPKLFWAAIFEEWPDPFRPWWPKARKLPRVFTLFGALFFGLVSMVLSVYFLAPWLEGYIPKDWRPPFYLFVFASAIISVLAQLSVVISGIVRNIQERRTYGSIDNSLYEGTFKVTLRFIFLGAAALFTLPVALIMIIFSLIARR